MPMNVDIFIKTYPGDYAWLTYCLRSINKFAKGFRQIVIITDDRAGFPTIQTDIPMFVHQVSIPDTLSGYLWQQWIKLDWTTYTDADAVVMLDSDTMLTKPASPESFFVNGKPFWAHRRWDEVGAALCWKPIITDVVGFTGNLEFMAGPGQYITRDVTLGFRSYIEAKFHQSLQYWTLSKGPTMSEFNCLGAYLFYIQNGNGYHTCHADTIMDKLTSIKQSWSWGGLSDEEAAERENILK